MVYALQKINADPKLLPGIDLGAVILDTCSRDTYALEQAMEFVASTTTRIDLDAFTCPNGSRPEYEPPQPTVAVVGAAASPVSSMVANILRLFKIPQVSYASTSPELSDKSRYDYFLRVVPPDTYQAQAMLDVVKALGWKYVSTIASAGNYGEKGIDAFKNLTRSTDICIAASEVIPRDPTNATFDGIVEYLIKHAPNAKGAVVFASETDVRWLLAAVRRANKTKHFVWIGSDDWGTKHNAVETQEKAAEGAITLLPARTPDAGFDNYFTSLNPHNHSTTWFHMFWERTFQCSFNFRRKREEATVPTAETVKRCSGYEQLTSEVYEQEGKVAFVIDATYAFAHALDKMQRELCNGTKGLCSALTRVDGEQYLDYLKNISFQGSSGGVRFNKDGDRPGSYDLFQYQRFDSQYKYVPIGSWQNGRLSLNTSRFNWGDKVTSNTIPPSVCSLACEQGYVRKKREGDECCWVCAKCDQLQYLQDEYTCRNCSLGSKPNANRSGCDIIEIEFLHWSSAWAIVPIILSIMGSFSTLFVISVFVYYNDTPVIRASGRELSYVLLVGILLTFATPFVIISQPSTFTCCLRRITLGLSVVISYSALFTKTNRVYRIFNSGKRSVKRPQYTSPRSQLVICSLLVSVQVIAVVVWLALVPPHTEKHYPSWDKVILDCSVTDLATVVSLAYAMLLVVLCTLYAFKTRKMPENFNEAKFIAFSMYTTCIMWSAFIPIYLGTSATDYKIQQMLLCLSIIISAAVTLGCIFAPKVYIVVLAPHKNKKQPGTMVMNSRIRSACGSAETRPNGDLRPRPAPSTSPTSNTALSEIDYKAGGSDDEQTHLNRLEATTDV
ncbi:metabotropic glutamate receptor 8-like [Diadema setosum]|uniref:metabotropic glutamate receptor 8-like n=1 Tax=Diadema setosum TaxID=31175 RepID=UPI003B3B2A3D